VYDIVFKSATTVLEGETVSTDVGVRSGIIEKVGSIESQPASIEIPCEGLLLMPGAIDIHAHLREPGGIQKEDIASGTATAVASGVTTVLEMPNTNPPTVTASALSDKVAIADRNALCHVRFYMALTSDNLDELEEAADVPGFAGVKVYLGSTTGRILLTDFNALESALARIPALFAFHAELESVLTTNKDAVDDPDASDHHVLRPARAVAEGTRLVLSYASRPGLRLHLCHLSSAEELELLAAASCLSMPTSEVTPHHLWFTHEDTATAGNLLKVNPPIRDKHSRDSLFEAMRDGLITAVSTDHAPHTLLEKGRPYAHSPSGVPGLDVMAPCVLRYVQTGCLPLHRAFEVLCESPAAIAGIDRKGRIREGYDADLALWDLAETWMIDRRDIRSRCGWSPFEGRTLAARPKGVWVMGKQVV